VSPTRFRSGDDFNWKTYHLHYKEELQSIAKTATLQLSRTDFEIRSGALKFKEDVSLLPSHHLLYRIITQMAPASVLEVGCGGGDHLANLSVLLGDACEIRGVDRSEDQLTLARKRNPGLVSKLEVADITGKGNLPSSELVYSHAVLMHISEKDNRFQRALTNMLHSASKCVVLIENWSQHDFMKHISMAIRETGKDWVVGQATLSDTAKTTALVISSRENLPSNVKVLES